MRNVIYAGRDAVVKLPDGSLVQCSSEPIHSPSSVQGHGILLVLSPCLDIQMISTDNVLQYTGVSAASLLGSFLSDILDYDMPLDALQQSRQSQNKLTLKARLKKAHTPVVLSLHYSPCGKYILVDLELDDDTLYPRDVLLRSDCPSLALLTEQIATLPRDTLQNFLDGLTNTLRQATGFERAFTYQFDQDGHAVILSESVDPSKGLEIKYKGFIFPRSDIPEQARNMYLQTRFQSVYDVAARVSPLLTKQGEEDKARDVNLMHSRLRAVSRTHLEYLRLMGVRASMSVAIPVDGKLWGMVSFHHSTPKRVHPKDMQNLASLSYMISSLIEGISWRQEATAHQAISDRVLKDTPIQSLVIHHESQETRKKDDDAQVFFFSTDSALDESNQAIQVLLKDLSLIRTYFSSDGAIIQINSSATLYDVTDEYKEEAIRICRFLRYLKSTTLITSRACQRDFEKELRECYCTGQSGAQVFDIIAGLLLFPISEDGSSFFAFIRIERVQTLRWGGNPNQPFYFDNTSQSLKPRSSFNIYHETLHGIADPWSPHHTSLAKILQRIYSKFHDMWDHSTRSSNLDKLKSMMIANVSHEIRTPLHAIINFTELALQDSSSHNVPGQVVEYIQHALNAGQRLMSTITDLLDLTRLDYGRETVNEAPFKLTSVLDNAIRMLAVEAEKKGLQTIVEFSDAFDDEERVGVVLGDEGKLWQATTNLLANAIKYTDQGFVKIECSLHDLTPTTLTLRVSVRDSGLGIPQEKLETIFDAFVRAHESRQQVSGAKVRPIEGTGLGLAIVARLIHMQNGTLEVSSREGEGSCFTFTLPYKVSNMAALRGVEGSVETNVTAPLQQKESENAPQVGHQLRILAAEDNPLNQQILQKRLERDGHILTLANDGVECLDHFKASLTDPIHPLFDLIIMDVQMPRMDGYEATRSIRTLEHQLHSTTTTYTPILAVSAHSYKSDLNSCKDSGMDGYATKPIVFARLKRLLEDVWEWRVNGTGWEVSVEGGDGIAGWF